MVHQTRIPELPSCVSSPSTKQLGIDHSQGGQVGEPVEYSLCSRCERHVAQGHEADDKDQGNEGQTSTGCLHEDLGSLTAEGETVQHPA